MKLAGEALWQHGTSGDSIKLSTYFFGRNSPVLHFRCVFIPCCPYSVSNIVVVEPALVPHDEIAPIILRVWTELREQSQTYCNEPVSVHLSARGKSSGRSRECSLSKTYACELTQAKSTKFPRQFSARHSGLLAELIDSPHLFRIG
jgi:hypothetical protein